MALVDDLQCDCDAEKCAFKEAAEALERLNGAITQIRGFLADGEAGKAIHYIDRGEVRTLRAQIFGETSDGE